MLPAGLSQMVERTLGRLTILFTKDSTVRFNGRKAKIPIWKSETFPEFALKSLSSKSLVLNYQAASSI